MASRSKITETEPVEPQPLLDADGNPVVVDTPTPAPVAEVVLPEPVVTMDDLGITSVDPYPTGSPPDPEDQFEAAHGFRRAPPAEV